MQKRHSGSSHTTTDLTSFPSLSPPDKSPTLARGLTNTLFSGENGEESNGGGTGRGRKATLANLTTGPSHKSGRAALFADSVPTHDIPGALHLADDAHIERLVAGTGAVKMVRQFARDLAQRDAEISALRQRADARERELKRMLRDVSVSNQDIERRLYQLENPPGDRVSDAESTHSSDYANQTHSGLNGLMSQAMEDTVGSRAHGGAAEAQATIRAQRSDNDSRSSGATDNRRRQSSIRGWQEYLFGSTNTSRKTSRASSIMSDVGELGEEEAERPRVPSNPAMRRKALDEQLFQPPDGPARNGLAQRIASTSGNGDDASIHSRKSSRSLGSWTVKLFAGNPQSSREASDAESIHNKTKPQRPDGDRSASSTLSGNSKGSMSAVAALKKINSNVGMSTTGRSASGSSVQGKMNPPASRRAAAGSVSQGVASETTDRGSTNLGPVEMDAILPMESKPPTLTPIYNNSQPGEFLTDRFGFIYDQHRKKRQREANTTKSSIHRLSITETLGTLRTDASDHEDDPEITKLRQGASEASRSLPDSPDDPDSGAVAIRRWQDYLRIPSRPTELLSHTPSAGPIVSLTTAGENRSHSSSVSYDKDGALAVGSSAQPSASTSAITADSPEFSGLSSDQLKDTASRFTVAEMEPVKLLLEQLTDLHDSLQRDRTVRWNEFLRKVRAERRKEGEAAAAAATSDRSLAAVATPEVSLADGEVVGIAGLGNKGKVGRAKWREFRLLVLGGIPVALRAKTWSECSGASAMRIPGYYDDLVHGVGGSDPDPSVVAQIDMDIRRTLTDNVFFRKGPGVGKLKEVLLAYSRRNPEVGYCQGMNLIAGSLLLIMPTAEDAFWILTSMIEIILPQHYYDHGLLASRADQVVLRQYISELLPKLSAHLEELGIELEALTFQWFLSVFTDCLSAEALYRVWDVVLCLNVTSAVNASGSNSSSTKESNDKTAKVAENLASGSGGGSTFLFQVALALLKLNEQQLLTTCSTPAALYTYINHQMTNHAISIDGLIQASEALRNVVRREDVVARRAVALQEMRELSSGAGN
ncbi:hypothetical protein PEX1_076060 [Penicillium expansum]|uniref:Rab-GAP TBC domain-containing protein n=1 Tax=Penicillium expansum TaxID=27334 RepID=A0A0A2JE94_PENEN|nr:hypothetical protein PEX2_010970 [Penicillium expansum]KGO37594.1 hypothetical protein PEXP_082010 [Penicillium expansum]KGO53727.1 hypothetical protein PEX1_076060 [Penicillium expansum]KGO63296.1 hypothetical protein PEX2_010970 [Penicillium expansum]